jgi:WD40 repeat protein
VEDGVAGVIRWSPDGKTLGLAYPGGTIRFTTLDGKNELTFANVTNNNLWDFSPDGRWLAHTSTETGQFEIWVRSYPDEKVARQISVDGGVEPVWCRCGELFYRQGNGWFSTKISTTPELRWDPPRLAFETDFIDSIGTSYDISLDGQRLLVAKRAERNIPTKLHIVTNWIDDLKRRVPAN